MSTKLEQLLEDIDPSKTYDRTFARVDNAINSFSVESGHISNPKDFETCLTDFFCHVESNVLCINRSCYDTDQDFHFGRCWTLLKHIYGPNCSNVAFEMAQTGQGGGLYAVLKAVALRMAEEYTENDISARISDYLKKLTLDEQNAAVDEYLEKYGRLLPAEMTEGSAVRIRANFHKVLESHPKILQKTRHLNG